MVTLDSLRQAAEATLIIFVEPCCGGCDALMPDVARLQQVYADRLSIAIVGSGALETNRVKAAEQQLRNFLMQIGEETSRISGRGNSDRCTHQERPDRQPGRFRRGRHSRAGFESHPPTAAG